MHKRASIILQLLFITLLATLLMLNGCKSQPPKQQEKTEEVIKIGATLALTGKFSFIGTNELRGLELAVDDINKEGGINGKKIILIPEDNQGDSTTAVTGVKKLLDVDNVDVLISAFTHITNAIKEEVKAKNKIMIYESTYKPIAQESKYFFRDYYDAVDHGRAVAHLVHNQGHKRVAILSEISDQCQTYENAFKDEGSKLGIQVVREEKYQTSERDLKPYLMKLNLDDVDALVTCAWRHEDILMKQLKELGLINKQTFHWVAPFLPSADTEELRELYEENNAISTWYGFTEPQTEAQKEFFAKFKQKYGELPRGDAMYMYDDIIILSEALKECDKEGRLRDPDCISDKLLKTDYDGVGGHISFDADGSSEREVTAIKVENKTWVNIKVY